MKRFIAVLLFAIIALCFAACEGDEQAQTTAQNVENTQSNTSSSSQATTVANSQTTQNSDSSSNENPSGSEVLSPTDITVDGTTQGDFTTTTANGEQPPTSPTTSTAEKGTTTTTKKPTSSDSSTSSTTSKTTTTKTTTSTTKATTTKTTTTTTKKTTTTTTKKSTTSSGNSSTSNFIMEMYNLVNAERAKQGLPALTYHYDFQSGADIRAREILTKLSHTRPDGTKWWTAGGIGDKCQAGAENIAKGSYSASEMMNAFMNSESHRVNILSTQYTHIVIGYYEGAWVQIFVKPR